MERFLHFWPFVMGIHLSPVDYRCQKRALESLCCCVQQAVEQIFKRSVKWDTFTLMPRHQNESIYSRQMRHPTDSFSQLHENQSTFYLNINQSTYVYMLLLWLWHHNIVLQAQSSLTAYTSGTQYVKTTIIMRLPLSTHLCLNAGRIWQLSDRELQRLHQDACWNKALNIKWLRHI